MRLSRCILLSVLYPSLVFFQARAQTISVEDTNVDVDEDAGVLTITVTHSSPPPDPWVFSYITLAGTATAPSDYTFISNNNLVNGDPTSDIVIPITDDSDFDPAETFTVQIDLITGIPMSLVVTVTINDDERIPVTLDVPANITVRESMGNVSFTLSRSDLTTHDFNVTVNTVDGTATELEDFTPLNNLTVQFAENEMSVDVEVHIIDDILVESTEMLSVIMSGPQIDSEVGLYIEIEDNDTPINYHCGRGTSQPCLNGGTCVSSTGICDCPAEFEGVNCAIETDNKTTGCGCVNGTCMNDGTYDVCICDPGFASEYCDEIAYFHQCTATGFSVCITPYSVDTFNGEIYVLGKQGESECNLALASTLTDPEIVEWCEGYAANIDYNSTCGELGPTESGEITFFELKLKVQYSSLTWRFTDEEVTFTCHYSNGSLQLGSGPISLIDVGTSVQRENKGLVPAALIVTDELGDDLPEALYIGTNVKFCLSVSDVPAFNALTIDRIVSNSTRPEPHLRTLVLYDYGCIPEEATGIITDRPYWYPPGENHTMCFNMDVFIFSYDKNITNPALGILIDFNINPDSTQVIDHESTCYTRRKRAVESGEENTVGTTFYLINPDAQSSDSAQDELTSCSRNQWLTPALIGLGTVCITLIVIIIVLSIAVYKGYKIKKLPAEDM